MTSITLNQVELEGKKVNLTMYQGDTFILPITFSFDLTSHTAHFTVKSKLSDTTAIIDKVYTTHTSAVEGKTEIKLVKTDTNSLYGEYVYHYRICDGSGNLRTYFEGDFTVKRRAKDVTC